MSDHEDIGVISEAVSDQMEQGMARDLAIKLLARLASQTIGEGYKDAVLSHAHAIAGIDGSGDVEVNQRIAAHFCKLMLDGDGAEDLDPLPS